MKKRQRAAEDRIHRIHRIVQLGSRMSYWQNSPALTEDVSINGFPVCWTCCFVSKVGYLDTPRSYGLSWLIISSPFKKDRVLAYHFFGGQTHMTIIGKWYQTSRNHSLHCSQRDIIESVKRWFVPLFQQVTRVSRLISSTHHVSWRKSCARSLFQHVPTRDSFVGVDYIIGCSARMVAAERDLDALDQNNLTSSAKPWEVYERTALSKVAIFDHYLLDLLGWNLFCTSLYISKHLYTSLNISKHLWTSLNISIHL